MAWRCSGRSNGELVGKLWENGLIESERVREAMLMIDRADFCPNRTTAYEDSPQSIGHSATISAPHMHASAIQSLLPFLHPGSRVLDIGSGSGFLTAVLGELVFPSSPSSSPSFSSSGNVGEVGKVVGLEHITALKELGETNVGKSERGKSLLREGKIVFREGDGRVGLIDGEGGWDAIHVGAAAVELHEDLVAQLKCPGRIFIPINEPNSSDQYIWIIDKDPQGNISRKKLYSVRYVPLTNPPETSPAHS